MGSYDPILTLAGFCPDGCLSSLLSVVIVVFLFSFLAATQTLFHHITEADHGKVEIP